MHMQGEEMHMRGSWTVQALAPPTINDQRLRLAWPAGLPLTGTHVFTASRAVCTDRSIDRSGDTDRGALACLQNERKEAARPSKYSIGYMHACHG